MSYDRPFQTRATRPVNILLGAEYPMIRWLEANGYDLTYQAGADTDRNDVERLVGHKIFLSVGHDEYWSGEQRRKVEAARDRGVSLAFFSGNEVFWRTRWEDGHRTLVVYKESMERVKKDPRMDEWTGTFRDSRSINPLGPQPENALTGTIYTVNAWRNDALEVFLIAHSLNPISNPESEFIMSHNVRPEIVFGGNCRASHSFLPSIT